MSKILSVMYDLEIGRARETLLTEAGFDVVTVSNGMEAARACSKEFFPVTIVGYASPFPVRKSMVEWLREHCPRTRIVSLYSDKFLPVRDADYVIKGDDEGGLISVLRRISSE